jgi:hypothetical protein
MADLISVAVQELQAVESQLSVLKARADELRLFIRIGTALGSNSAVGVATGTASVTGASAVATVGNVAVTIDEPIKVRAIRGVERALRNGQPKTARQLVQELAAMGVVIGGQEPSSNLSAILSQQREKFRNERGQGYFLVEPQKTEPADAGTSAGSEWLDPSHAPSTGTATAAD